MEYSKETKKMKELTDKTYYQKRLKENPNYNRMRNKTRDINKWNLNQKYIYLKDKEKFKEEIYKILGSSCKRCGITDKQILQIDHVNGNGLREIKADPRYYMYKYKLDIIKANPEKFQILCCNCNWKKRYENNEVRKIGKIDIIKKKQKIRFKRLQHNKNIRLISRYKTQRDKLIYALNHDYDLEIYDIKALFKKYNIKLKRTQLYKIINPKR